jgi:hypothetical protein
MFAFVVFSNSAQDHCASFERDEESHNNLLFCGINITCCTSTDARRRLCKSTQRQRNHKRVQSMHKGDIAGLLPAVTFGLQISREYPNCLPADWIPGRSRRRRDVLLGNLIGHMKAVRSVLEGCIAEGEEWADNIVAHLESNKQGYDQLTMMNDVAACLPTSNFA